jgi:hypothetical protein
MVEQAAIQLEGKVFTPEVRSAIDQALDALERVLTTELADHQVLLADLESKREAIRMADLPTINEISRREEEILRRMRERAAQRGQLGQRVAGLAKLEKAPLSVMVALAPDERASRLRDLKSDLETAANEIRRRSTIVRSAAESLSKHLAGVLQTVTGALSRAGVYGRRGTLQLGQATASSLDLRS